MVLVVAGLLLVQCLPVFASERVVRPSRYLGVIDPVDHCSHNFARYHLPATTRSRQPKAA